MKRSGVVGLAMVGLVGVVAALGTAAAAAGASTGTGPVPDKTLAPTSTAAAAPGVVPPSSVPPLGGTLVQPTIAPPTSSWLPTTPTTGAPTVAPTTVPVAPTTTPPGVSTVAPATSFDGLAWLTQVYAALTDDPFTLLDIAEDTTILNTPADWFVAHLLGVAITEQIDIGLAAPVYTVTRDGKAVRVCSDAGKCDVFADFYAPTGRLETFSMNGLPLSLSAMRRQVNVESLSVESGICLAQSDGTLSCVLLVASEGASTVLTWEQAVFTATDGRQFGPDLTRSAFTPSIADGGVGSGHIVFPGAPIEGEITLPIVSGMSGAPNVVTVEVRTVGAN